jgi:hypothetical protein
MMHGGYRNDQEPPMKTPSTTRTPTRFEVRFKSLFRDGVALAFPCDSNGRVDLDRLSEAAKGNYLFARAMVGREFACPAVQPIACD